jgi:hypothetical protein
MTLDRRFVACCDLEEYFVNKITGEPLAGGIVTFYEDENRTTKKAVWQITGSPPNYSFSALPNPLTLSGVGTFQDAMGNNITPYYFPYQGTPSDSDGTVELYYVTVESATLVPQFTRPAWPPNVETSNPDDPSEIVNLIPNGQFLAHTDITSATNPPLVSVSGIDIQNCAQGGWSFNRTTGGASVFDNSFVRITSAVAGLDDYPPFAFNFKCTSFSASDQVRDWGVSFPGVNSLSAGDPVGDQNFTYFFAGESQNASTYVFDVRLIRNFGTGGSPSPQTDTSIGTLNITPSFGYLNLNIDGIAPVVGTLGDNKDDYVRIALRGPASTWDVVVTDFILAVGNVSISFFPTTTSYKVLSESIFGSITPPTANDLYLPVVITPKGVQADHSGVGSIEALTDDEDFDGSVSTVGNQLICDGGAYLTTGYSPLGIPYSRLQGRVWNSSTNLPKFGTGQDYATAYIPTTASSNIFRISTNQDGSQSVTINGTVSTGFTFTTIYMGNSTYDMNAYITEANNTVFVSGKTIGEVTDAGAGTSGFSVAQLRNTTATQQLFSVTVGALPAAGNYFTFTKGTSSPADDFYVWFSINGAGVDPAPGGTGILVPLLSTYTTANVASLIREAISGFQGSNIQTIAASGMTAGAYFTFHADGNNYVVWYEIAGLGSAPAVVGTFIKVELVGSETATQVATATQRAINFYQFAVPNLKGAILRGSNVGVDDIPGDLDFESRFSLIDVYPSSGIGTYQFDQNLQHQHDYDKSNSPAYVFDFGATDPGGVVPSDVETQVQILYTSTPTELDGGAQNVPFNFSVNYVIRY